MNNVVDIIASTPIQVLIIIAVLTIMITIGLTIYFENTDTLDSLKELRHCDQLLEIMKAVSNQEVRNIAASNWIEGECWK